MDRGNIVAIVVFALISIAIFADGRYCWKTLTHRITPRLATWLIFLVGSSLSLASYRAHVHAGTSFMSNIANYIDVTGLVLIVASVLISARHEPERLRLNRFESVVPRGGGGDCRPLGHDRSKRGRKHSSASADVRRLFPDVQASVSRKEQHRTVRFMDR